MRKSAEAVFFVFLLAATASSSFAQITYTGKVLDGATGDSLPGVNVFVPGTTRGTATDSSGRFRLQLAERPARIAFSSVGYLTRLLSPGSDAGDVVIELEPTLVDISPLIVTAGREMEIRTDVPASISSLSVSQIEHAKPSMLYEVLNQVAGVHMIDLGNEQYKMSVRQPFTNKAYFLYMEDGVPLRPTGIFNPNALIDVNMSGVDRVEVLKGPVSAMYGSNAVAGALNFVSLSPDEGPRSFVSARMDNHGYKRTDFRGAKRMGRIGVAVGGYLARQRDAWFDHSDFDKIALTIRSDVTLSARTRLETSTTISHLDTDTNGALDSLNFFSRNISSLHTFTFRDMRSTRIRSTMRHTWSDRQRSLVTGYFRDARIGQLPYWRVRTKRSNRSEATGEINEDRFWSLGIIAQHEVFLPWPGSRILVGTSVDYSPATYTAEYIDVKKDGEGRYASYTAPDSMLTDYRVRIRNEAAFARFVARPVGRLQLIASLRVDRLSYDYNNHLDGSAYSGAPDGRQTFSRVSPKIGLTYDFERGRGLYANYSLGFVPPEVNELYNGVKIPSLDSAHFDSYEVGGWMALFSGRLFADMSLYAMDGRDEIIPVILDDGTRENRNAGHTKHRGIEYTLLVRPSAAWNLRVSGANALHEFVVFNENGNDYSGNTMMNAPGWIVNAEITAEPAVVAGLRLSLEWQHVGPYELDNRNSARYDGYDVFNARASFDAGRWRVWANLRNLLDETYATTAAAYSFGTLYNAGQVRTLTIGADVRF